jgi:hypothetical protein
VRYQPGNIEPQRDGADVANLSLEALKAAEEVTAAQRAFYVKMQEEAARGIAAADAALEKLRPRRTIEQLKQITWRPVYALSSPILPVHVKLVQFHGEKMPSVRLFDGPVAGCPGVRVVDGELYGFLHDVLHCVRVLGLAVVHSTQVSERESAYKNEMKVLRDAEAQFFPPERSDT